MDLELTNQITALVKYTSVREPFELHNSNYSKSVVIIDKTIWSLE